MADDHPIAAPGYGKRSAPSQHPSGANDFAHLGEREAYLAHFIDRLPDGAAIDVKTLARMQPLYGQQAVRSALRLLEAAGHLKRELEQVGEGITRWVRRTFFSRTARPGTWWREFLDGRQIGGDRNSLEPVPPARSQAYRALASLGKVTPKLMLSEKDCEELEPFAAEWFARGVTEDEFRHAMANDLPSCVRLARAFVHRRLVDRIPPVPPEPKPSGLKCARCRTPVLHPGAPCRRCAGAPPGAPKDMPKLTDTGSRMIAEARAMIRTAQERAGKQPSPVTPPAARSGRAMTWPPG